MRLCVDMVFQCPSDKIGVHNSHLGFEVHSKKGWGYQVEFKLRFHLQTDGKNSVLFKPLRICLELL